MRKTGFVVMGLIVIMSIWQSFGFWVKRDNSTPTPIGYNGPEGSSLYYGPYNSGDSNFGVWVELPDFNLDIMQNASLSAPSPANNQPSQENTAQDQQAQAQRAMFTQFSDVSSDIEYEARLYKAIDGLSMQKKTFMGNIIKISGKYDYYPDDARSYGFRFYNEYMSGLDYENTFNAAGSAEVYFSHEYFVGSIQVPYLLTKNVQLVGGLKKAFVFKDWNLSNYILTVGASRRF